MGFFLKKNKGEPEEPSVEKVDASRVKKKSDKDFKPRAPRSMTGKKVIRTLFWIIVGFILIKGVLSFMQGTKVINEITYAGSTTAEISDSIKGFAVDFATEYFTWDEGNISDRSERLAQFVKDVDSNVGLNVSELKNSSRVTSAEIYASQYVDDNLVDVTVVVWREVQFTTEQTTTEQIVVPVSVTERRKAYMVVPVTLASDGPVVDSYPRFVNRQEHGDEIDRSKNGTPVTDQMIVDMGSDLVDSYLRAWYEGKTSQLKYFLDDPAEAPVSLVKSDFTYVSLKMAEMYEVPVSSEGIPASYRIIADVVVHSDLGEKFTNTWTLFVTLEDGRLYVLSSDPSSTALPSVDEAGGEDVAESVSDQSTEVDSQSVVTE